MITRISKIARLPAEIREQLNRRLHNGEMGRTILPWLNELPETKTVLADLFSGKIITHQNLSEWRHAGYQDWLQHQQRLEWFDRFTEQETELAEHDGCSDTYEAFSRLFLFEIGQAFAGLQKIKNPADRTARLQNLMREFCQLQNSYNWSRRVALEWDKYKDDIGYEDPEDSENNPPEESQSRTLPDEHDSIVVENGDRARPGRSETRPRGSLLGSESSNTLMPPTAIVRCEAAQTPVLTTASTAPPGDPDASSRLHQPIQQPAATAIIPLRPESKIPTTIHPIPSSPPPTTQSMNPPPPLTLNPQPPRSQPRSSPPPIRGRRFVCIEG